MHAYATGCSLHVFSLCRNTCPAKEKEIAEMRGLVGVRAQVDILPPNVMVLRGGALGRWLGQEGEFNRDLN